MLRILFIILVVISPLKALALIEVDITRGNLNPLPVAVSPLSIDENSRENFEKLLKKKNIGAEIAGVVEKNLKASGLFNPLNKDAFLQAPDIANLKPRFEDWNLIKAQALITGKVNFVNDKLRVEFRLWDVLAGKEMMALAFTTVPNNWRRVGHIITDKVYERLTGEKGYFDTRIIYVAEEGPKTRRIKKLAIMDQDGANNKFLTLGNELVLTPRFNPTSQMVTYLSYFRNLPRVYLLDIETGMQEVVGDFPGMTFAPRFSPNGKKIIMSFAKDGNSDIYTMDLENRIVQKITNHPSIDTSPSYSPNGKYICSTSIDQAAIIWDVNTSKRLNHLKKGTKEDGHSGGLSDAAWHITNDYVCTASDDNTVKVWDCQTSDILLTLGSWKQNVRDSHSDAVVCVDCNPQGSLIASGSSDMTVRLWEVRSGKCVQTIQAHSDRISSIQFNFDGRTFGLFVFQ